MEKVMRDNGEGFEIFDGERLVTVGYKEFFNTTLFNLMDCGEENETIFANRLNLWGLPVIYSLQQKEFTDITQEILEENSGRKPKAGEFSYTVASMTNTWYSISIKSKGGNTLNIFAFENLVPLNKEKLLSDFGSNHETVAMYNALTTMRAMGCTGNTISSSAYALWKATKNKYNFKSDFYDPTKEEYDFVKKAHHGGLCYNKKPKNKVGEGIVLDCNSLYPYEMYSKRFPVGKPIMHTFGYIPERAIKDESWLYYVKFRCQFWIKDDHIPFVRIKGDWKYDSNEVLETSMIYDQDSERWYDEYVDTETGEIVPVRAEITMFKEEYKLFFEQYDVTDLEIIECYVYFGALNVFDDFIERFMKMKEQAKNPSERRVAKMIMNSLSGNLAKRRDRESSCFTKASLESIASLGKRHLADHSSGSRALAKDEWGHRRYIDLSAEEVFRQVCDIYKTESRSKMHIVIGASITSYGMCDLVRSAQKNYKHFLYTDTDSMHLDCKIDEVVGVEIDDKKLGCWKVEHEYSSAVYIQPKVYCITDKKEGIIVKWSGMRDESRTTLEKLILFVRAGGFENPFLEDSGIKWERDDEVTDFDWGKFMRSVEKEDHVNLWLPYGTEEVMDFENFTKMKVSGRYVVDITDFI